MYKIVECVPNFSEGRVKEVINAIADAIHSTSGVSLLDVDPGASTNRTVYTFVGSPDAVVQGALAGAKTAFKLIDMSKHSGEHPRMGAMDVCPFVPVKNVTVEECVALSKTFGRLLAEALNVPVYLYGAASQAEYRKTVPQIRAGEYEGLTEKLKDPAWKPDFGPSAFAPKWGATATGVRKFLIAYNINLLGTKEQAHRIALNLREQGRSPSLPGRLKGVQGIGWYLQENNLAQISLNLTDYEVTPIHVAYEEAKKDAEDMKLAVTGSEIVGLVPLNAILEAAEYYIQKERLFVLEEEQKVHLAVHRLGLSTLSSFSPKEKIIEYRLQKEPRPLAQGSVEALVRSVAERTPSPGGGSVAANVAALGSALGAMVGQLTYGKKQWEHLDSDIRRLLPVLHHSAIDMTAGIDEDAEAFADYMQALKLPQGTGEEKELRAQSVNAALNRVISVPLTLMKKIDGVWDAMEEMASVCNFNCKSDVQVGARCLETASWGAYYNVLVNIPNVPDEEMRKFYVSEAKVLLDRASKKCSEVLAKIESRLI